MKHDNPQNLSEECENLREAWADLVRVIKIAFWQDVARVKAFFKRTFHK